MRGILITLILIIGCGEGEPDKSIKPVSCALLPAGRAQVSVYPGRPKNRRSSVAARKWAELEVADKMAHLIKYPEFPFDGRSIEFEPNRFKVESKVISKFGLGQTILFDAIVRWTGEDWIMEELGKPGTLKCSPADPPKSKMTPRDLSQIGPTREGARVWAERKVAERLPHPRIAEFPEFAWVEELEPNLYLIKSFAESTYNQVYAHIDFEAVVFWNGEIWTMLNLKILDR